MKLKIQLARKKCLLCKENPSFGSCVFCDSCVDRNMGIRIRVLYQFVFKEDQNDIT